MVLVCLVCWVGVHTVLLMLRMTKKKCAAATAPHAFHSTVLTRPTTHTYTAPRHKDKDGLEEPVAAQSSSPRCTRVPVSICQNAARRITKPKGKITPAPMHRTRPRLPHTRAAPGMPLLPLLVLAAAVAGVQGFLHPPFPSSSSPASTSFKWGQVQNPPSHPPRIAARRASSLAPLSMLLPFQEEPWFASTEDRESAVVIETTATEHLLEEAEEEDAAAAGLAAQQQQQRERKKKQDAAPQEFKVGVIVVDHGSRKKEANDALVGVVADFQALSGYELVEPAHMELAEPSIATAFGRCVERGATFIICHPFFLSRGRHVQEDIPTLLEEAASIFPGVSWALSQPLGLQADIPKLMQRAVDDCMLEQNIQSEDHLPLPAEMPEFNI